MSMILTKQRQNSKKRAWAGLKQMGLVIMMLGSLSSPLMAGNDPSKKKCSSKNPKDCQEQAGTQNSGGSNSAVALSELVNRSFLTTIKDLLSGSFAAEFTEEFKAFESATKDVEVGDQKNNIFLEVMIENLAARLYQKNYDFIVSQTKATSHQALLNWSRVVSQQSRTRYPNEWAFYTEYLGGLDGILEGFANPENKEDHYQRIMDIIRDQVRAAIAARSPRLRAIMAKNNTDTSTPKASSIRLVNGTAEEVFIPGNVNRITSIDFIIPDVPMNKLVEESPSALRMQKVINFAHDYSAQTVLFNLPLYWVTLAHVGLDYARNPMAITQFFESLKDPVANIGFAAFIAANHSFSRAWMQMMDPRYHFLGGYLGMAMGMTASSLITGFWYDPSIQKCAKSYLKDRAACQSAYDAWVPTGKINELVPGISGLVGTAIVSGLVSKGLMTGVTASFKGTAKVFSGIGRGGKFLAQKGMEKLPERYAVRLAGLHILPKSIYNGAKLEEYLLQLRKVRGLVNSTIITIGSNLVFLALDPFVSQPLQHGWQKQQQTTFNLGQFLELNTPLGNLENMGRLFWHFDNIKMPHDMEVVTLPQVFKTFNKSMDYFLNNNFELLDPKTCLPEREIPTLKFRSSFGLNQDNVAGQRTNDPNCFIYEVEDPSQLIKEVVKKPEDHQNDVIKLALAGWKFDVPLAGTAEEQVPTNGEEANSQFSPAKPQLSYDGEKLFAKVCIPPASKELLAQSQSFSWTGKKSQAYIGLRECLETADLPFWMNKYAEAQRNWRTFLLGDVINSSLQWSTTISDFITMFGGTRYFYEYVIQNIWAHRQFAQEVTAGSGTPEEKQQKIRANREALLVRLMSRYELLKLTVDKTKVPPTFSHIETETVDGKVERKVSLVGRTEEEQEKYKDLYPSSMGDFRVTELSDYLVTSMACGPRVEDRPSATQKFMSLKWLPWESIAAVLPTVFSTTKITEPFTPVLETAPGMKFEFVPPRVTEKNEACDRGHWVKDHSAVVNQIAQVSSVEESPVMRVLNQWIPGLDEKVDQFNEVISEKVASASRAFVNALSDDTRKNRYSDKATELGEDLRDGGKVKWKDKSAPIYWQTIKIGDKSYRGVIDYLIDHIDDRILRPDDRFQDGFVDWYREKIEDPMMNQDNSLWSDVKKNYDTLLTAHLFPVLSNTDLDKTCEDGTIHCGLQQDKYLQAKGVVTSAMIEFQTYLRSLRKMLVRLGGEDKDSALQEFDERAQGLIFKMMENRHQIKDFDFTDTTKSLEDLQNRFGMYLSKTSLLHPSTPKMRLGLNGYEAISENREQTKLVLRVVSARIFGLMSNILTELGGYKNYLETLNPNKTDSNAKEAEASGPNPFDPRARFSH